MRAPKWTTLRWHLPGTLRKRRLQELMAKGSLQSILGEKFIEGIEKRKIELEKMQWRLLALQLPIFLFLSFSLLDISTTVSVMGISAGASKNLREVLLLLSTFFGLKSTFVNAELGLTNELLKACIDKMASGDSDLKEFLETRYGFSSIFSLRSFDNELNISAYQWSISVICGVSMIVLITMLALVVLAVQLLSLMGIYTHPNFSQSASIFVIAAVVLGDIVTATAFMLRSGYQPYQSYENFNKLVKLQDTNQKRYQEIIEEIVRVHFSKSAVRRLLGRPKMKRLR